MMTSPRPRGQVGDSFASRRGHASQLSISDPSHHVTEAIGTLYGDEDDPVAEAGRPLSFVGGSAQQEQIMTMPPSRDHLSPDPRRPLNRSTSDQPSPSAPYNGEHGSLRKAQTLPVQTSTQRNGSGDNGPKSPRSPTVSLRDVQADPSTSQFTLTNIDNPNDIAQELSNLQALRRMSMDVGNIKDPDMPPMSLSSMPVIAPSGDDDENDPSRLLWVPARVHPELAPTEFQSFLETRVNSIRRRSRDSLSPDGDLSRSDSGRSLGSTGSLKRQKSMLSRQIDNSGEQGASGYVDGAERLERERSRRGQHNRDVSLDDLVKDPTKAVQKLAQESQAPPEGSDASPDDMPILPMAPGMGLRRSTRTTYRKGGSLRSGDKQLSRRAAHRHQDSESGDSGVPPMPDAPRGHGLTRVQSEPISDSFSRPSRSVRRPQGIIIHESPDALAALEGSKPPTDDQSSIPPAGSQEQLLIQTAPTSSPNASIRVTEPERQHGSQANKAPERSTSQKASQPDYPSEPIIAEPPPKSSRRKISHPVKKQTQQPPPQQQYTSKPPTTAQQQQNLNDQLAGSPSPLPGSGSSRTDSLTFIPAINEEKKSDKKSKKDRDDDSSSTKSSGSAWKWFKSSTEDKKKDEGKKSKTKALVERAQDNVRLDVIQTSIEKTAPPKGRESFVLDRDAVDSKLQEERKKENNRRSDSKKEKDGSIFSSIFGGSKKKEEKEKNSKKKEHLRVPSEPPMVKPLEPDVDYHWTRFPLLEERAIYRMAHIKLANPRRPLLSQVLLSNFMYSYLAIVQAMHPNMNVPVSPQQKRLEEEARRKREEEEYLAQQQMMDEQDDQGLDQYDFDYHRATAQYADAGADEPVDYVDDAQIYEDEHGSDHHHYHHHQQLPQQHHHHHHQHHHHHHHQDYGYDSQDPYDDKDYYQYPDNGGHRHHDGREDMW